MGFDTVRFWPAYRRAGMLSAVQVLQPAGQPDFDGRFEEPTGLHVDGMAESPGITLEYPTSTPVALGRGARIVCLNRTFRVLKDPERLHDGWLTRITLQEIFP